MHATSSSNFKFIGNQSAVIIKEYEKEGEYKTVRIGGAPEKSMDTTPSLIFYLMSEAAPS